MQYGPQRHHRVDVAEGGRYIEPSQHAAATRAHFGDDGPGALREHPVGDTEFAQRGDGVRRQVQGEAEFARVGGALEDADAPAGTTKRDASRQSADAGAHD